MQAKSKKTKTRKVDHLAPSHLKNGSVFEDYDCMLNQVGEAGLRHCVRTTSNVRLLLGGQTNINNNNNKYYVIQLVQAGGTLYLWTRWGRVV